MELSRKRKPRRLKRIYTDAAREDMAVVEVTAEDAENRNKLCWKIRCGDPRREKLKEEEYE